MHLILKRFAALAAGTALLLGILSAAALPAMAAENTLYIGSVADLKHLAEGCVQDTWSKDMTVLLTTDLDLTGSDFTRIPLFSGTFDGQGHTISGFTLTGSGSKQGLFRQLLAGSVVQNLHLAGLVTPQGTRVSVGGIAGINYGTIRSCTYNGTVSGTRSVGGIVGSNQLGGVIEDCSVSGSVSAEHRSGGIAGENMGEIKGCTSEASVNTTYLGSVLTQDVDASLQADELISLTDAGGIAGYSSGIIQQCDNTGKIGYNHVGYNIGGIAGRQSGRIEGCTNTGEILGRKDVGGILGQMDPDVGWNLNEGNLGALQGNLDDLQTALNNTIDSVSSTTSDIKNQSSNVLEDLQNASSAVGVIAGETASWLNANLSALNDLSDRITLVVTSLGPIAKVLAGAQSEIALAEQELNGSLETLDGENSADRAALEDAQRKLAGILSDTQDSSAELGDTMTALDESNSMSDVVSGWKRLKALPGNLLSISEALTTISGQLDNLPGAKSVTGIASSTASIASAVLSLRRAMKMLSDLCDQLAAEPSVQFALLSVDGAAQEQLMTALSNITNTIRSVSASLSSTTVDFKDVNNRLFSVLKTTVSLFSKGGTDDAIVYSEDISALESENRNSGIVRGCTNYGSVTANSNVGGITGAITLDLNFDDEDEWNISALISQGARYLIYAAVYNCSSYAAVTAEKSASGGITGRMDYGALLYCQSSGDISSAGDYVGGISGYSTGTLYGCKARTNLTGRSYVGGISGLGGNIGSCLALPHIVDYVEYGGSIAGGTGKSGSASTTGITHLTSLLGYDYTVPVSDVPIGTLKDNFYANSTLGGVDGFSFAGQTDPISYEELLEKSDNSPLFATILVTFVADGTIVKQVEVPFGGSIETLPSLPDKDGKYWVWDSFVSEGIYYSTTVNGRYCSPNPTLSTGEEPPHYIVQGSFYDDQTLTVLPFLPDLAALNADESKLLAAGTLTVNRAPSPLTVRMLAQSEGKLYTQPVGGSLTPVHYTRDGSYIVFELANGGSFVYLESHAMPSPILFLGAAAALLALLFLVGRRHRPRKEEAPLS